MSLHGRRTMEIHLNHIKKLEAERDILIALLRERGVSNAVIAEALEKKDDTE